MISSRPSAAYCLAEIVPGNVPGRVFAYAECGEKCRVGVGLATFCRRKTNPSQLQNFRVVGREAEYRIQGIPGLVLVAQRPRKDGRTSRIWRVYYSLTNGNGRTIRKVRLGPYPAIGLAEARRRAAELMEAVERGADPVAEQGQQMCGRSVPV